MLLCGYMCTLFAAAPQLAVRPSRPVSGELFTFEIILDSDEKFSLKLPELPDGLRVSKNISSSSFNTTVINGKRTATAVYGVAAMADKPGKYTIAPFTLDINGKKVQTNKLEITVRDAAQLPAGEKFSAKLTLTPQRRVYVGEVVRADVELFLPGAWQLLAMPEFKVSGFGDPLYLEIGKKGETFVITDEPMRYNGGTAVNFTAMFQVQKSGTFTPLCQLEMRTGRRTNDFFSPIREQMRRVTAESSAKLTVIPLPPAPENCINTGLIGNWQISAKFSKEELKTGDLGELILNFTGSAPVPAFHAPQLDIPGTRVYPAEVTKSRDLQTFTVKYPFVAVKSGKVTLPLALAYFDVQSGKYTLFRRELHFTALPGIADVSSEEKSSANITAENNGGKKSDVNAELLTFTLLPPGKTLRLPLIKNVLPWIAGLLLCGVVSIILSVGRVRRNTGKKPNRRQMAQLIKAVKRHGAAALQGSGREIIAAAMELAPGATFEEIAEKVDDPEIAELLRQLAASGFAPGKTELQLTDGKLAELTGFLKKLSLFAVLFFALIFPGKLSADYQTAADAFDQGRFREAAANFSELTASENSVDPALLYDLGCAWFMLGDLPQAHLFFTRAHLLEPWNSVYRQAMERSKEKLTLPGEEKTFSRGLQHLMFLRPDNMIVIAAAIFAAAGVFWLWRRRMAAGLFITIQTLMVLLMVIFLTGAAYLHTTVYSFERAMVTAAPAPLRAVPAESAETPVSLPGGSEVIITGENGGFWQIRTAGASGWISKKDAVRIFPYKIW